ncbi:DUF3892 domain-containing protein [uncultured Algoriphagus sp.]|uniref:DUF3892 domain-containing protein n=1 Tax=uncultured Algoriphagus sp. TaxID=417365 RepID=UPI0030EC56B6|tara:strand:- start:1029 stop:1328 length:300 start_codon:yes stop_codon:yes gene_type:complete
MTRLRIHFVKKEVAGSGSMTISQIGGINNTGERWVITAEKAIEGITHGNWEFFILENHHEISVTVIHSTKGIPNLTAIGEGYLHNLLEDLPEIKNEIVY